jgi:hypothetical protein
VVPAARFAWLSGNERIASFVGNTGYRNDFCSRCGSPLPSTDGQSFWIPAGLFDEKTSARVVRHIFVGSKADWDEIGGSAPQFEERPE